MVVIRLRLMDEQGFQKKKSLGQHFLTSNVVPGWMCDAADIKAGDIVMEIGPGTGVLTAELLNRGAIVIAVEADTRAIDVLSTNFESAIADGTLTIHHADARSLDQSKFGIEDGAYKVVSNIPYYLSGHLFRTFLESDCQPNSLVFLVQKEVAERIARDKKSSILSLSVKVFGNADYVRTVSRGHFTPPPKIDSAIVAITLISRINFKNVEMKLFFELLHLGFGEKRKQLLGNLSKRFRREALIHILSTHAIRQDIRAEDLSLEDWLVLTESVQKLSPHNLHT